MRIAGIYPQYYKVEPKVMPTYNEPLGLEYVLAMAKKQGHAVKLFIPVKKADTISGIAAVSRKDFIKEIKQFNPDVAAFSLMTTQVNKGFSIAKELKQFNPKIVTVCGGYHSSALPGIVREKMMDFAVIGEGEYTFKELLHALKNKGNFKSIKGLAFRKNGKLIITGPRERNQDLDSLPWPIRDIRLLKQKELGLLYPPPSKQKGTVSLVFSKGCPYNCYFCAEPMMSKRIVIHRSPKKVVDEIQYLQKKYGINHFFFTDTNFTINKEKVLALCNEIKKRKVKIHFEVMGSIRSCDDEMLRAMAEAGCIKIGWGIESISNQTLAAIHKNINASDTERILKIAANYGILNLGFFIIGFDWEDEKSILEEIKNLPKYDIHRLRVTIATPIPGSEWYTKITKKRLNKNLNLFDTEHFVYKHPKFTEQKVKELQNKIFKHFYQSPEYKKKIKLMVKKFPRYRNTFNEYFKSLPFKMFKL